MIHPFFIIHDCYFEPAFFTRELLRKRSPTAIKGIATINMFIKLWPAEKWFRLKLIRKTAMLKRMPRTVNIQPPIYSRFHAITKATIRI